MSFGISNSVRSRAVRACTPELFWKCMRSDYVAAVCAGIADAWEQWKRGELSKEEFEEIKNREKKRLPIFTFHATFPSGRRLNADAVPTGLSIYDIDHLDAPREYFDHLVGERVRQLGIVLAHVTPSMEGLRLVFRIPEGMSLAEAQHWMSTQLGDPNYDQSVKDLARSSFAVPEDYVLYVDEEGLFLSEERRMKTIPQCKQSKNVLGEANEECPEKGGATEVQQKTGGLKQISGGAQQEVQQMHQEMQQMHQEVQQTQQGCNEGAKEVQQRCNEGATEVQPSFKGIPYADIIKQWFILAGGEPAQGERNTKLHRLACHLRHITDNDEALLLKIMPRYGLAEEEMKGLIHSACTAAWCGMPRMMQEAVGNEELRMKTITQCKQSKNVLSEANEEWAASNENSSFSREAGILHSSLKEPPAMPSVLPPLIALLVSRTPDIYKPAVAHAVFPPLAAHLHRVTFRYIDNVAHEATLMNVLMAGTGAGKDCISEPINRIMADIRKRDARNLERERLWKQEVNSRGANKDKRQRPEGLVIQEIDADMTNPAFVMRTAEADGHFLYTKLNEIDQFDALRGSGKGGQQFQIMCLAFDPGNRYGQTRVGAQSVTEKVTVRFNWNAATTILKGKRYFSKVLTDGPISRINFCTIPEREIGADMPVYGAYDAAFDEELRPYIENLVHATGQVDCPEAYELAKKLCEENAEFSRLSQSRVYENLSFRANVIAYLKACVLYVAQGYKWDKPLEDFIRWSLQYDMWCKMEFFGDGIEQAMATPADNAHRPGRRNLLTLLPDEFTLQDAIRVRQAEGLDTQGASHMLSLWKSRGYISIISNLNYRKLKYRSDGIDLTKN